MTEEQETKLPENSKNTEGISIGNSPYPSHDIKKGNGPDNKKENFEDWLARINKKISEIQKALSNNDSK